MQSPEESCWLDYKCYGSITSTPPWILRRTQADISRQTSLSKILNEHATVPMNHLYLVLCDRLSEDLLTNRDWRYLTVPQLSSKVFCRKNYYWVEFINRLHHLVGFGTIRPSAISCTLHCRSIHHEFGNYHPDRSSGAAARGGLNASFFSFLLIHATHICLVIVCYRYMFSVRACVCSVDLGSLEV